MSFLRALTVGAFGITIFLAVLVEGSCDSTILGWSRMALIIRDGTLPAIAIISMCGLAVGHLLGGPDEDDRPMNYLVASDDAPGWREVPFSKSHPKMTARWHTFDPVSLYWAPKFVHRWTTLNGTPG